MIELNRHIEILLLDNDCVIVPGLGGFMAHHVAARYDAVDGQFVPPLRTLGFNPQLKLNDSLLAQSYVEAYDMSYPEALRRIEDEVGELRQCLENEGCYELDDIGTLSLNEDGNYVFEPCEAGILTPDLYGLSSFEMKPLSAASAEPEVEKSKAMPTLAPVLAIATESDMQKAEKAAAAAAVPMTDDTDGDTIRIKVAWIRNAVAVAAAILAFFVFTTPIANSDSARLSMAEVQKSQFMSFVPQPIPASAAEKPAAMEKPLVTEPKDMQAIDNAAASKVAAKKAVVAKDTVLASSSAQAQPKEKPYCIVLASHVTRHNADAFVEKLHAEGYTEAYTYEHNKIVRVVYGQYDAEGDAQKDLRGMRDKDYFEQSWVYKKR